MANTENVNTKKLKIMRTIGFIIFFIVLAWFCLLLVEFYRVKINKKPLFCFNDVKDVEDDDEYSITCFGPLYKYREYHYNEGDEISAKEFTLIFKEFDRTLEES